MADLAGDDVSRLDRLREENRAAWARDVTLSDYAAVANASDSKYIPALEAEVERLRTVLAEGVGLLRHVYACKGDFAYEANLWTLSAEAVLSGE